MPRIPIKANAVDPATGNAVAGVSVTIKNSLTTNNVTVYSAQTGGSTLSNPITTDSNGRAFVWVDRAPIRLDYSGTGITAFSEWQGDLANEPDIVSALPGSPADGQQVFYQDAAMATAGVVWNLRYRAGGGTYKWEFVGGNGLSAYVQASQTTASTTYTDLGTVGPSLTVPLAGDYTVDLQTTMRGSSGSQQQFHSYTIGGAAADDANALQFRQPDSVINSRVAGSFTQPKTFATANTALVSKYRVDGGAAALFWQRWLRITPIRVG